MKKLFTAFLCAFMIFGLVGCGGSEKPEEENNEPVKTEYAIGETAEVDGIKITVNSTRVDEGLFGGSDDGTIYFVLDITLENTTDETFASSSMMCYELKDGDGRKQDLTVGANLNGSLDTEIDPGEKGAGEIAFKTNPEGTLVLTFTPGAFSSEKVKFVVR